MHSSMIGKIEKAHRYAREPERVRLNGLNATFHGGHDEYEIALVDGHWTWLLTKGNFAEYKAGKCPGTETPTTKA